MDLRAMDAVWNRVWGPVTAKTDNKNQNTNIDIGSAAKLLAEQLRLKKNV
jgi:hypothetical protein